MKVKVLVRFKDKHTKKIHKVNDVLEVTDERYKEILTKGKLVEEISEEPTETPEEPAETPEEPTETPEEGKDKKKSTKKTTK